MQAGGQATIAVERIQPGSGGAALAGDRIAQFLEARRARFAGHGNRAADRAEHHGARLLLVESLRHGGFGIGTGDFEDITRA